MAPAVNIVAFLRPEEYKERKGALFAHILKQHVAGSPFVLRLSSITEADDKRLRNFWRAATRLRSEREGKNLGYETREVFYVDTIPTAEWQHNLLRMLSMTGRSLCVTLVAIYPFARSPVFDVLSPALKWPLCFAPDQWVQVDDIYCGGKLPSWARHTPPSFDADPSAGEAGEGYFTVRHALQRRGAPPPSTERVPCNESAAFRAHPLFWDASTPIPHEGAEALLFACAGLGVPGTPKESEGDEKDEGASDGYDSAAESLDGSVHTIISD